MTKYIKYAVWLLSVTIALFLFVRFAGSFFVNDLIIPASGSKTPDTVLATIGKEAPYFNLSKISGGSMNLSDLAGKPSVLVFWATWNTESADQIKIFEDYKDNFFNNDSDSNTDAQVRIISINNQEDRSIVSSFLRRGGYGAEVLLDQTGEVGNRYGVQTLPAFFFIDKGGIIRDVFTGVMSEAMIVDKVEKILK